jgi:hypothetical protein
MGRTPPLVDERQPSAMVALVRNGFRTASGRM